MDGQLSFQFIPENHLDLGLLAKVLRDVEITRNELEELLGAY
jgi:hypothetical protein